MIRNTSSVAERLAGSRATAVPADLYKRATDKFLKRTRRRTVRYGILAANVLMLVLVIGFVVSSSGSEGAASQSAALSNSSDFAANPLDQLSSADLAVEVARLTHLDQAVSVKNNADSINDSLAIASASSSIIAKPQIISTTGLNKSNKDIVRYTTKAGDTLSSLAAKFGITSDSIRGSNSLGAGALAAGKALWIPPVDGIVHRVKAGDTPASLAIKYRASKDQIIKFNDAEAGLKVGTLVVIPNGAVQVTASTTSYYGGFSWGAAAVYGYNGYDYGFCTWYVASKISIPANWGNANTWDSRAAATGWTVSSTPKVGAIGQTDYIGVGHVGIVEAVSADGKMIKYSDMNGLAGWGRVGYSGWVPLGTMFQKFIYR